MHPRKTRLPPLPRRYFLLSALRNFVRWFSCQGAYVSRRRWRLPGAARLRPLEGFGSIKAAREALYAAHEHSPECLDVLTSLCRERLLRGAFARIAKAAYSVRVAMLHGRVRGFDGLNLLDFAICGSGVVTNVCGD